MHSEEQLYEVEFKAFRRQIFDNPFNLSLKESDWVIVEAERGEDMGRVHRLQTTPLKAKTKPQHILRLAGYEDLEKRDKNHEMEEESMAQCRELIGRHNLEMKLVDVEYQFDCNKLTFFFTADQRVDFRSLVKDLAQTYRTRIELRQIGVRDEARRMDGFGICGLRQCCNTFIKEFAPISTQLARDQNLSLNPAKISGNCGRLLCCLQYEQNHYEETLKKFPEVGAVVNGRLGPATVESVNALQEYMIIRYEDGQYDRIGRKEYRQLKKAQSAPQSSGS